MGFLFQLFLNFLFPPLYYARWLFHNRKRSKRKKKYTVHFHFGKKSKKKLSTISKTNNTHKKKKKRRDKWSLLTQWGSHTIWELEPFFALGLSRGVYLVASFHSTPKSWPCKSIKSKKGLLHQNQGSHPNNLPCENFLWWYSFGFVTPMLLLMLFMLS